MAHIHVHALRVRQDACMGPRSTRRRPHWSSGCTASFFANLLASRISLSRYVTAVAALLLFTSAPSAITAQAVNGADVPTMRAYRLEGSISIDGRLDEEIWSRFPAAKDFVQKEPVEGDPALNDSEAWILYDDDAISFSSVMIKYFSKRADFYEHKCTLLYSIKQQSCLKRFCTIDRT